MAEFLSAVKLFIKLYPLLVDLGKRAGKLYTEIKVDRENSKIEIIFDNLAEGDVTDEDIQDNARRFNDLFR